MCGKVAVRRLAANLSSKYISVCACEYVQKQMLEAHLHCDLAVRCAFSISTFRFGVDDRQSNIVPLLKLMTKETRNAIY